MNRRATASATPTQKEWTSIKVTRPLYEWLRGEAERERRSVSTQLEIILEKVVGDVPPPWRTNGATPAATPHRKGPR